MESCISEIFSSISSALVLETVKELHYYSCHFNSLVEELQQEGTSLAETTSCIQDRVDHARRQTRKTMGLVHTWLEKAETYTNNMEKLLYQANINKSCCFRKCPNWIWRYNLGKKLAGHIKDIKKCIEESRPYIVFERVSSLTGMEYFTPERCFMSKNRQYVYDQLMGVLKSDEVNTIGLYGIAGCGKSTFAIEFGRKAEEEGLFHKVVFVEVPDDMKVGRIQEKIASCLSYDFQEKEEMQRAQRLSKRLIQEEKVLVIMDNVKCWLDLEAIGVPPKSKHKGCKVLITTRSKEVCIQNDCQEKIKLSMLDHEEAWSLFQIVASISEESSDTLQNLARRVSDKCGGLIIAITAVARTLKGKTENEWKAALLKLRSYEELTIGKGFPNPYDCLRLSYDDLESEAQSLFLLCAVFPEVSEIQVEHLIKFATGLGLVGDFHSFERSRDEVTAAINNLTDSCLLSDSMGEKCVKMHGLVRTVALSIAKNENKLVKCTLDSDVTMEYGSIRYLWCKEFPNELDCSGVEFLCMKTDSQVPDDIFQGMGKLRVLMLCWEGHGSGSLSTASFKWLTNLRCLFLEQWKLGDISFLVYMTKLESLTILRCSFFELPDFIVTQLKNLRLLHLSECDMKMNPFKVIGRHERLEELYIDDSISSPQWDLYNESTADFFKALKRYHIQLGAFFADYQEKLQSHNRTLFLSCFDASNSTFKNLAKKAQVLFIANIQGGAKNIIPNIFHQAEKGVEMNDGWTEVLICDSEGIEHLVDTDKHLSVEATLVSKLRKLKIERMESLKGLYHGRKQSGLFMKLEELYIEECPQLHKTLFDSLKMCYLKALELYECPKLTSVFTPSSAQSVVNLERLEILYCDGLKHVVADDRRREQCELLVFQKLKFLTVRGCKKIEYIIPLTFAKGLVQLECMEIEVDDELKYLFGPCKLGPNQNQNEQLVIIELPLLKSFILNNLSNIISICPRNCHAIWPSLCEFVLRDCPRFDTLSLTTYQEDGSGGTQFDHNTVKIKYEDTDIRAIREMKDCELSGIFQVVGASSCGEEDLLTNCLQKLSNICKSLMQSMNLQNLEQMELSGSKEFLNNKVVMDHIGFKKFVRENHHQGDQIFNDDEDVDVEREQFLNLHLKIENQLQDLQKSISIPQTHLLNYNSRSRPFNLCILKRLVLTSCLVLRTLFSPSSATCLISLEELLIADCHGLRYLVTCESSHHEIIEEEEIIIPEDYDSQSYASKLFPKLKRISVMNCNSLEYILHVSLAQGLVELKCVEIWNAPQLRYVFGENIIDDDDDHVHVHVDPSHQHQNNIQIKLPVLENMALFDVPNMINICPDSYYCICSSLLEIVMNNVGLFTLSVQNLMVHSASTNLMDAKAASHTHKQLLGSISIWNSSKIEGIFHLDGFPNSEWQVMNSWLKYLDLRNLPELRYIWKGTKHFVTVQNLSFLNISGCKKLKAIFSTSVLKSIPQLKILVVQQCDELEQIIEEDEEDEIASYPQSTKVCFSKLKLLIVMQCNKLNRMFYISRTHELPELEYLIVYQNPLLVEVFEECERVASAEVLLPEIKHIVLVQLPNLNNISHLQGIIDFEGVTNLLVHSCPKLSLTSTTMVEDMLQSHCHDKVIDVYVQCHLAFISYIINEENANNDGMLGITFQLQENHQHQHQLASSSEVVSSQVIGSGYDRESQPMDTTLSTLTPGVEGIRATPTREVTASMKQTLLNFGSELSSSIHNRSSIEDKREERYQEDSTSEDKIAVVPADSKGNDLGVVVMTHNQIGSSHSENLKNVDVPLDTQSSHSLGMVKLGAFKHFLDETEIALLAEAMDMYPHLWKAFEEFSECSERFQTLKLKTLADMLFFLRNESAASVTAQREKGFLRLCNDAVQLGFEKSWVEEMRQRVMFRDSGVHHAESRLNELHYRHDELAQELCKIKDEIHSLHNFVESQKKCFYFL